jgi:hypothetical protein
MNIESYSLYTLAAQDLRCQGTEPPFVAWLTFAQRWPVGFGRGWSKTEAIRAALDDALRHSPAFQNDAAAAAMEDAYNRVASEPLD